MMAAEWRCAMRWTVLLVMLWPTLALAQVDTLPGEVYQSGALRVRPHGATGCPATSCRVGGLASASDGTWCVCDSSGAWVEWASGGDISGHLTDTTDAHDASAISVVDDGWVYIGQPYTTAQAALNAPPPGT
jgi:hypothetical protein